MKCLVLGVVLVVVGSARSHATEPIPGEMTGHWLKLEKGTRVRLIVEEGGPAREVAGRLLASDAASVTVDGPAGPQRFSRDQLFHLRYLEGGRDHKKGAAIGASITGAVGLIAGLVVGVREVRKEPAGSCEQCGMAVGFLGIAGGIVGAIPGGAIGFAIGTTGGEWRDVKPDGLTVAGGASRRVTIAVRWPRDKPRRHGETTR